MRTDLGTILLAEDNLNDAELTMTALRSNRVANEIVLVRDGAEALDYLYGRGAFAEKRPERPALMLLDLKMPKIDGLEVLKRVKQDPVLRSLPVVILTSSREEQDLVAGYSLGVNAYVVKPVAFNDFLHAVRMLGGFWGLINEPPPSTPASPQ
jgi:CheY-like chemotaxis protein